MHPAPAKTAAPDDASVQWLHDHGPKQLEQVLYAVLSQSPLVIVDDNRAICDVSLSATRLLGRGREALLGQDLDDLLEPGFRPELVSRWADLQGARRQSGFLQLRLPGNTPSDLDFVAIASVMPDRHTVWLRPRQAEKAEANDWAYDCALFLRDKDARITAWYEGAERMYGYSANEAIGQHASFLAGNFSNGTGDSASARSEGENPPRSGLLEQLNRAEAAGYFGTERWQEKRDGSRFWANSITVSLRDEAGRLMGFAAVIRDFTSRRAKADTLPAPPPATPLKGAVSGIISGQSHGLMEANDAFLDMIGYSRADQRENRIRWPELTPLEFAEADELAHEECMRFGACTPYQKELIRKDLSRATVLVAKAVVKLVPFDWLVFVQDLSSHTRAGEAEDELLEQDDLDPKESFTEIVGGSAALRRVQRLIEVVAPTDATVLILGETGTGKELVARAVHRLSPRCRLPFVTLNCAAIPTGLLESELFGYERGAFTGALSQKIGRFEMAHRGTLFLDEVGDIPLDLQPKLLRALQEKSFERLGGTKTIPIDVRLVAATNRDLTRMMGDKLFRSDLYYRLKVFPVTTPPLRDRPEDIPLLARHFIRKYAARMGRDIDTILPETLKAMVNWPWPGNVRELENFIERSVILSRGPTLRAPLGEIRQAGVAPQPVVSTANQTLEQVEREYIIRVLRECAGVVTAAATRLGLHRTTLNAMMRKLGISRTDI